MSLWWIGHANWSWRPSPNSTHRWITTLEHLEAGPTPSTPSRLQIHDRYPQDGNPRWPCHQDRAEEQSPDGALDVLQWIERQTPKGRKTPVEIEFCPEAYLLFSRVAGLLRQSVSELLSGLLLITAGSLKMNSEDGEENGDFRDCFNTAPRKRIKSFRVRARIRGKCSISSALMERSPQHEQPH